MIRWIVAALLVLALITYGHNYGALRDAGVPPPEARVRALAM